MALKFYQLNFGGDVDPTTVAGLTPTFTQFWNVGAGTTAAPPGITQLYAGAYFFQYDCPVGTQISFLVDGGSALSSGRFIRSDLTAIQGMDVVIGSTASAFGTSSTDPGQLMGMVRRTQEFLEGLQNFNKTSGIYTAESRGGSLLMTKTLTNTTAEVDRS